MDLITSFILKGKHRECGTELNASLLKETVNSFLMKHAHKNLHLQKEKMLNMIQTGLVFLNVSHVALFFPSM